MKKAILYLEDLNQPQTNKSCADNDRNNAPQQDQHGVVTLGNLEDSGGLVEGHALLLGAQRGHIGQISQAAADHEEKIGRFQCQVYKSLYKLAADNIGKAKDHKGKLCEDVAVSKN